MHKPSINVFLFSLLVSFFSTTIPSCASWPVFFDETVEKQGETSQVRPRIDPGILDPDEDLMVFHLYSNEGEYEMVQKGCVLCGAFFLLGSIYLICNFAAPLVIL